jgi:hypothetical protein
MPAVTTHAAPIALDGQAVYDTLPLGAQLRFFDGTPRPPERFRRKLADWRNRNDEGRLVEKCAGDTRDTHTYPATFILHLATYGSNGTIVLIVNRGFNVTTPLQFEMVERPRAGMVRVLTSFRDNITLRHLAPDMAAAKAWLAEHHYSDARFEIVTDDGADHGRAA